MVEHRSVHLPSWLGPCQQLRTTTHHGLFRRSAMPGCAPGASSGAEPTTHSWSLRYSAELPRPEASVRYIWLLPRLSPGSIISVT